MTWDPYLDLAAGVLANRLGVTDPAELAQAEAEFTAARIVQLHRTPLPGGYDLPHLQAFHRHIFGDVYAWAGELRIVHLGRGAPFCPPHELRTAGDRIFRALAAAMFLRDLPRATFVDRLADLLAAVNALHPFREGNGRAQRAFLAQLARDAGHPLRWARLDPAENTAASRAAHRGDTTPLRRMLDGLVEPARPGGTTGAR